MGTVYRLQMPIIDPIDFVLIPAPTGQRYRLMNYDGPYAAFDVEPFFMSRECMLVGQVKQIVGDAEFRRELITDGLQVPIESQAHVAQFDAFQVGARLPTVYEWEWAMLGGEDGTFYRVCSPNKYGLKLPSKDEWTCTKVDWSKLGISDPMGLSVERSDVLPNRFRMDSKVGGFILELRGARMGRRRATTATPRAQDVMSTDTSTSKHPFRLVMPFEMMKWIMNKKDWVTQREMS